LYQVVLRAQDSSTPAPLSITKTLTLNVLPVLSGQVLDSTGTAVPGATVELTDNTGKTITAATADATGHYSIVAPAGTNDTLTAWAPRFQPAAQSITVGTAATVLDVRMLHGRAGGETYRMIAGVQQAGASSTQSVRKLFADLFFDVPGPIKSDPRNPTNIAFGPPFRFWGDVRVTSVPETAPVQLSQYNLGTQITSLNTSQIAQSVAFLFGAEYRIWGMPPHGPGSSPYIGGNNNADDTHSTQKFTGSLLIGGGAVTPINPQESATLVSATAGDAAKLYNFVVGPGHPVDDTTPVPALCPPPVGTAAGGSCSVLALLSKDRERFQRQYFFGLRMRTSYFSPAGIPVNRPAAMLDVSIGQNEEVTGGRLRGVVFRMEAFYPLPFQQLNMVYLFGRAYLRGLGDPGFKNSYALQPDQTGATITSASVLSVTMPVPDRDIYSFGIGMDMLQLVKKLTAKTTPGQ
jgi:hypothetical protein